MSEVQGVKLQSPFLPILGSWIVGSATPPDRINAREVVPGARRFEVAVGVDSTIVETGGEEGSHEVGALGKNHGFGWALVRLKLWCVGCDCC